MPVVEKNTITTKTTTEEVQPEPQKLLPAGPPLLVVDLRKKYGRKQVRKLRKGKGKLAARVEDMVAEFYEDGALKGNGSDPAIVVVVRQKRKKRGLGFPT